MFIRSPKVIVVLMVVGLVCMAGSCFAMGNTYTWLGGGEDDNWSTNANWNSTPSAGTNNTLKYEGPYAGAVTSNNDKFDTNDTFKELIISCSTGDSITITGDGLALTDGINITGGSVVIDTDLSVSVQDSYELRTAYVDGVPELTVNGDISGTGDIRVRAGTPITFTGANTYSGGTLVDNGTLIGSTTSLQGDITLDDATQLHFDQSSSGTYSGVIDGWGFLYKKGSGTVTLTGTNTYIAPTYINEGILALGASDAIGSDFMNINGGTFDLGSYNETLNTALNLYSGGITGSGTLTAPTYNLYSGTVNAALDSSGTLNKSTSGTLVFGDNAVYQGSMTVSDGLLKLSDSGTFGDVLVNSSGVLSGSGTVAELTINNGGILSPGLSPGTISAGDTIWGEDGNYLWEINDSDVSKGNDPGWDWLDVTGTLTIDATAVNPFTIDITSLGLDNNPGDVADFSNSQNYDWILASASAGISGFATNKFILDATDFSNALGGGSFSLAQDSNDIVLSFTSGGGGGPVPEPSTILMMVCLGLGLLWYRRRKM